MRVGVNQGAVLLTVRRSYVGNDVTHSTLLDRAGACSYENLPKYRSYRVSNTVPVPSYFRFPVNSKQFLQYTHHSLLGYPCQLSGPVFDAVCLAICPLLCLALQNNL